MTMSVEGGFFGKNVRSMMMLGHARGMALLGAAQEGIPVYEYSPRKIKQSVTGNGNATKDQVNFMIKNILGIKNQSIPEDASDALAVAICHTKQFRYDD
jgi:crossover junction endodeoxyribonuclease RuvC